MDKQSFYEEALRLAREAGCEAAEIYAARSDSFSVNVLDGTFDRYESSSTGGMSLRVKRDGRDGYAYTEAYEEPEELVAIEGTVQYVDRKTVGTGGVHLRSLAAGLQGEPERLVVKRLLIHRSFLPCRRR